jgi:MoxR-like ATPase
MGDNMHQTAKQLTVIRDELSSEFFEQRNVITFLILALLSKEHAYMLGVPGVAKSNMIRSLVSRLMGLTPEQYFETLMSRTRSAETVMGPIDIKKYRDTGEYVNKIDGYIQQAVIAMIDEIGKMGPDMGHQLLPVLLERIFHQVGDGRSAMECNLYTAFTASNELIVNESDDAKALWDRLLLRTVVHPIKDPGNLARLLDSAVLNLGAPEPTPTTVDWADLANVIDNVVPAITLTPAANETMIRLADELHKEGIDVSPRRLKKSVRVVQAAAFLEGRDHVVEDDITTLRYVFWDTPEQIEIVDRLALVVSNPTAEKVMAIIDASNEIMAGVRDRRGESLESRARYGSEAHRKVKSLMSELGTLKQDALAAGRGTSKLDEASTRLGEVRSAIYTECLDFDAAPAN